MPPRRLVTSSIDLDLGRGVGEDLGVGVGRRAGRVARMAEQVGGPPQQLHAGPRHVPLGLGDDRLEVGRRLGEGAALGRDVAVVEAVVRDAELVEELERRVELRPGAAPSGRRRGCSHGRSNVPDPKTSEPGQLNECHRQTPIRRWSSIRLPRTSRSGS